MLGEKSDHVVVRAPDDVLDGLSSELGKDLLLLEIEESDRSGSGEKDTSGSTVVDVGGLERDLHRLGDAEREISNVDGLEGTRKKEGDEKRSADDSRYRASQGREGRRKKTSC